VTVTAPVAPPNAQCGTTSPGESGIFAAATPSVGPSDNIKLWVSDENPPCTGWDLKVNAAGVATGYSDTAYDGQPFIALYLTGGASTGTIAYYPDKVWGDYNNNLGVEAYVSTQGSNSCKPSSNDPSSLTCTSSDCSIPTLSIANGGTNPNYETPPSSDQIAWPPQSGFYIAEYFWSVSALNLPCGSYAANFTFWDGDRDRAYGCTVISLACPPSAPSGAVGTHACITPLVTPAPIVSTITVTCGGVSVPQNPTNGWTFDTTTECFTFNGTSASVGGSNCNVTYL